jgi:hypothetical protein
MANRKNNLKARHSKETFSKQTPTLTFSILGEEKERGGEIWVDRC